MANDGQIVFEVTADGKHAIANIKDITKAIEQETKKWDDAAEQSTASIADSFSGMLKKIVAGFSLAKIGQTLLNFGKDALQAASDLEEVQNVVDTTFGSDAGKIDTWAKNAATQFGLTETQAKRFTSTLGAMMKSSGLAGKEITDMSTDLAGLAADMASFYNLDFDTAFQKIRSGISGETEPLKQLGINMSTANLEAFALAQGLEKTWNQMTQGEQVMLRYQYLMQATSDAQGDFAKTSDGYANSIRRAETAVESIKEKVGNFLIGPAADALTWVNDFLDKIKGTGEKSILDEFNEINVDTQNKLTEIDKIRQEAEDTKAVLDLIFGNEENPEQGQEAAEVISKYGVKSKEAQEYLEGLGFTTEEINAKQEEWLETCRRLVKTIPGLSAIINTETGEVKGGTRAVEEYVNAWSEGQKKIALLNAQAQKKAALEEQYAQLPGLEVNKLLWADKLKKAKAQLEQMMKDYGLTGDADSLTPFNPGSAWSVEQGLTYEQSEALSKEQKYYANLKATAEKANDEFEKTTAEYKEALKIVEDGDKVIEETYGSVENVTEATYEWDAATKEAGKSAVTVARNALTALEDYAQGVRDAVEKSVDKVISGFDRVERATDKANEKSRDYANEEQEALKKYGSVLEKWKTNGVVDLDKMAQNWNSLSKDEQKAYNELAKIKNKQNEVNEELGKFTASGMKSGLEDQIAYMKEYVENLDKARKLGLSNELLASLSDGSAESAEYLKALVASPETAKEVDKAYQEMLAEREKFTSKLTESNLAADESYQKLYTDAKAAVEALGTLPGAAGESAADLAASIASGINQNVPEVKAAVDAIIAQLNRLSGWGININVPTISGGGGSGYGVNYEQSYAVGTDYVPRDMVALIHEGEAILTKEENKIRRGYGSAQSGFDYDTMGGVMRDNIKPGGNVYLDGRIVGSVISDQQGKSYRQLQRSGWQG